MSLLALAAALCLARADAFPRLTVDPRIELLAVVHVLAADGKAWPGFSAVETPYGEAVLKRFGRRRGHPALEVYRRHRQARGLIDLQKMMLLLSDPPELKPEPDSPWDGAEDLRAALAAFSKDAGFPEFFAEQKPYYDKTVAAAAARLDGADYARVFEAYTGLKPDADYAIVLCPLRADSQENLAMIRCGRGGARAVVATVGPEAVAKGTAEFSIPGQRFAIWHELGHLLLDPLLAGRAEAVSRGRALFAPLAKTCYGTWEQCLREHLAQGLAHRLADWAKEKGLETRGGVPPRKEHLPLLGAVEQRLKEFEADRKRYKDLTAFYPRLLDALVAGAPAGAAPEPGYRVPPGSSECGGSLATNLIVPPLEPEAGAPEGSAAARKRRAVWLFSKGDAEGAFKECEAARALAPDDAEAALNCSVIEGARGRGAEARRHADDAVRLALASASESLAVDALSNRAALAAQDGRKSEARSDLDRALGLVSAVDPRRPELEKRRAEARR